MSKLPRMNLKNALKLVGTPFIITAIIFGVLVTQQETKTKSRAEVSQTSRYFRFVMKTYTTESFIVRIDNPEIVEQALIDLSGDRKLFPAGEVKKGDGGFNVKPGGFWNWHFDPNTVVLREDEILICESTPADVEINISRWNGKTFCPSQARLDSVYDTPPLP
ncbi:MAG: hypothetical protein US60_C0005G0007 [Microgenomates group bacterium GW2011_GWC1_37_8]|uniref:BP74 N-terminal domain-containing protein n=2 Tax=Candidatus Woeseibacteriota TaxID=1752722 RepID=A0A0G0NK75_9BACT|nr:MAG: hypothetical protein US60_C0005G0007 [Microgenomates group bacterium GW2011_GWC1_37_8]KKQ86294.1 MAG: hypothetical protein UT08_C0001G0160 [Candidatus Woesebacteria bacterium GW2011_GWB1_38_8]OGM22313.1 MAG: hypothetical protein A2863_04205 [Candidatus Woesebacteria bacterium RIFCSPHIGHO2_01_FULL_38_9b]